MATRSVQNIKPAIILSLLFLIGFGAFEAVFSHDPKKNLLANKIFEGCPMYIPKNLTLTQLNDILEDNIPITIDAKTKGFKR